MLYVKQFGSKLSILIMVNKITAISKEKVKFICSYKRTPSSFLSWEFYVNFCNFIIYKANLSNVIPPTKRCFREKSKSENINSIYQTPKTTLGIK